MLNVLPPAFLVLPTHLIAHLLRVNSFEISDMSTAFLNTKIAFNTTKNARMGNIAYTSINGVCPNPFIVTQSRDKIPICRVHQAAQTIRNGFYVQRSYNKVKDHCTNAFTHNNGAKQKPDDWWENNMWTNFAFRWIWQNSCFKEIVSLVKSKITASRASSNGEGPQATVYEQAKMPRMSVSWVVLRSEKCKNAIHSDLK